MSVIGLFAQSRPSIAGLFFDAVLDESSELITEVTEFPVETGAVGNDHAVQRPLTLIMRVGVSDNPSRALRALASDAGGPIAGNLAGTAIGAGIGQLSTSVAVAAGLSGSLANAAFAAGQARTRSQSALEDMRTLQRENKIIDVVGIKGSYKNMMITATRQGTTKENEQSLELVVEMRQLLTITSPLVQKPIPAPNDPAFTQAQPEADLGLVNQQ